MRSHGSLGRKLFALLDTNSNGTIDFEEFVSAHAQLGRGREYNKLSFVFRLFDTDGDGFLTKAEAMDMMDCCAGSFRAFIVDMCVGGRDFCRS